MQGPNKRELFPIKNNQNLQFIKNQFKENPLVEIGDFTYYDSNEGELFSERILYHYPIVGDKLIIGKYCSIAPGITIIMNGANHRMEGSTYPFNVFGYGWEKYTPTIDELPSKGDVVIGNDVWIGKNVTILPGVTIGDGAIIGANAVVSGSVLDFSVVVGNPAQVVKMRFSEDTIKRYKALAWWHWSDSDINKNIKEIMNGDILLLENYKMNAIIEK